MEPLIWPPNPIFKSVGEEEVFNIFKEKLAPDDALIANAKFQSPAAGDIEIDLIYLSAAKGIAVIENKGGHLSYNGQTWMQSDRTGTRSINPHDQVTRNLYALRDHLRASWSGGNIKTEWMVVFPGSHIAGSTRDPDLPRERIVDLSEIDSVMERAEKILEANLVCRPPRDPDWVPKVFEVFRGISLLESDREIAIFNNYSFVKAQTHERRLLLRYLQGNDRIAIQGPAGSGKTWLAFEQADMWAAQGLKVAIIVFNRGIQSYMKIKNREKNKNRCEWVGTFYMLMDALGSPVGEIAEYEANPAAVDPRLLRAAEGATSVFKFDAIIVDEAQEIYDGWWPVVEALIKENGKLAIFGDIDQRRAGKRGMPESGFAKVQLFENLRNSQQIATAVTQFSDSQIVARGPQAYDIEYIEVQDEAEVIPAADDAVARMTDEELWELGEIALLTTKRRHPIHRDKVQSAEGKISYWDEYWAKDDVFYGTVSGFKGLERSVVVLAIDGFHNEDEIKEILYVGMTRARDRLVVVSTPENLQRIRAQ